MSILHAKDFARDGRAPLLLYGYGSYGMAMPASFNANRLSLVDRGFVYAIAHIRGGADKGWGWYLDGKREKKTNTFDDFAASGRALIEAIGRVAWEEQGDLPLAIRGKAGYVVHCVEIAFWWALHGPSLEEALIFLAEAGGDTDTNAAVAGALLGARDGETGIPPRWLDQLGSARSVAGIAERLVAAGCAAT